MTDHADLIAEARDIWEADDLYPDQMIPRLVKALEAAERRAEEAEREHQGAHGAYDLLREKNRQTRQQRDALAAVVEKVRAYLEEGKGAYAPDLLDILATAPADVLREVKAEAWDEGWHVGYRDHAEDPLANMSDNPYRTREEQDRG